MIKVEMLHSIKVLAEKERLEAKGFTGMALEKAISKAAVGDDRVQPFYNTFKFSLADVMSDPDGMASNLVAYINGFSLQIREIFEKFEFEKEIDKLDESNRLYLILKEFCNIDLTRLASQTQIWEGFLRSWFASSMSRRMKRLETTLPLVKSLA